MNLAALLGILDIALSALKGLVPGGGGKAVALADVFARIGAAAAAAYEKETGQPLDLSKIPPETPIT